MLLCPVVYEPRFSQNMKLNNRKNEMMQDTQKTGKETWKKYVRVSREVDPALEETVLSNFYRTRIFLTWNEGARTIRERVTMIDFLHDAWSYVRVGPTTISFDGPMAGEVLQIVLQILSDACGSNYGGLTAKCVATDDSAEISVRPDALNDGLKIKLFGSVSDGGV